MTHIEHMASRFKLSFFLINLGIRLLPKEYRTKCFINNIMATNIIKVIKDNDSE